MILFLTMGAWHGLNAYWLCFGLLHGVGFCGYTWFRMFNKRHGGRFVIPGWPGQALGAGLTYIFVCSCWVIPSQVLKYFPALNFGT
jgi:D-alanyl-lipoteichoic acid acyltransferase DltB (MBOAT superfamily)